MADYHFTEIAEFELDQIWTYLYLNGSELIADRQVARLRDSLRILARHPEMGLTRYNYGHRIRRYNVPSTSYYVLYRLEPDGILDGILIVRILHGSRDPTGYPE